MRKLLLSCTALAALSVPASADTIVTYGGVNWTINAQSSQLTLEALPPPGNQPKNIPCIICGTNQPQQFQDFGFNNYKQTGNVNDFTAFSDATQTHGGVQLDNNTEGTAYDRDFLRLLAIGLRVLVPTSTSASTSTPGNTVEQLAFFGVLDTFNHVVLAYYNPATPTSLPFANNGTGYPDYQLTGFDINRNDILPGAHIEFVARWLNASDGAESFFLVPQAAAVPGPIVGAGIPGLITACMMLLGLGRYRRKQTEV